MKSFLEHAKNSLWVKPENSSISEFLSNHDNSMIVVAPGDEQDVAAMASDIDAIGIPFAQVRGTVGGLPGEKTYFLLASNHNESVVSQTHHLAKTYAAKNLLESLGNTGLQLLGFRDDCFPGMGRKFTLAIHAEADEENRWRRLIEGISKLESREFRPTAILDGWLGKANMNKGQV